jgi:lipid-binding SYLF domain-containing protein
VPGTADLASRAQGLLVIPDITSVGLFAGGAYGEGALMVGPNRAIVDYYSLSAVSLGFQIGASNYNQALFFMTTEALQDFRVSDGWELGAGAAVVVDREGAAAGITTTRINRPIVEVVFGQRGLQVGASLARGEVQPDRAVAAGRRGPVGVSLPGQGVNGGNCVVLA